MGPPPKPANEHSLDQTDNSPLKSEVGSVAPSLPNTNTGHDGSGNQGNTTTKDQTNKSSSTQFILPTQIDPSVLAELPDDVRSKLGRTLIVQAAQGTPKEQGTDTGLDHTQFILPTQVDSSILASLPEDIRSRLGRSSTERNARVTPGKKNIGSERRAHSPSTDPPTYSQVDPSILADLPEDIRAEVLGYQKSPRKPGAQALLPQSPRKVRTISLPRHPVKRKRGRPRLFDTTPRNQVHNQDVPTLTQSNFVARPPSRHLEQADAAATDTEAEPEADIANFNFLAALPKEIRAEVLAQERRERLQRLPRPKPQPQHNNKNKEKKNASESSEESDLNSDTESSDSDRSSAGPDPASDEDHAKTMNIALQADFEVSEEEELETFFQLPPRPPKPTFTAQNLSDLPELRSAIKAWHSEFLDESPYAEDVQAFVTYLQDVVRTERNVAKATAVTRWLGWCVEQGKEVDEKVKRHWEDAVEVVKEGVQQAARERGLGVLDFE